MSIDDRIRDGLVRNADVSSPSVERHLDRIRVRRRRRLAIRVAAVAAAVALVAALPWALVQGLGERVEDPVAPPPGLPGTYRVLVGNSGSSAGAEGTWTVTLEDDGSVEVEPPAGYDENMGGESYELSAPGELTTNLFVGAPGCQRADPPVGVYGYVLSAEGVRFSRVEDECPARVALFAESWERLK